VNDYAVLVNFNDFIEINGRRVFPTKASAMQARDIWADSYPTDHLIVVELVAVSRAA